MMRLQLMYFILLFLISPNICGSIGEANYSVVPDEIVLTSRNSRTDNVVTAKKTSEPDVKTEIKKETEELIDDKDYNWSVLCGDHDMSYEGICFCGNRTLDGNSDLREGNHYCCVPPSTPGQEQCSYDYNVRCENGEVKLKTESCHQRCYNPYRYSQKLYKTASLYCQENDYCIPLDQMCSGVCKDEEELCDPDKLRCPGYGHDETDPFSFRWVVAYSKKSLNSILVKDHGYCLKVNNDQQYDTISRGDEKKIIGSHQSTVNYTTLVKCNNGHDGILCSGECKIDWCAGTGDVCSTPDGDLSMDHPELCGNSTFWRMNNFSCNYSSNGQVEAVGERCTSDYQHCSWMWYTRSYANPIGYDFPSKRTCFDKSDQVFPVNTTCSQFNANYIKTFRSIWCTGEGRQDDNDLCDEPTVGGLSVEGYYSYAKENNQDYIIDSHNCRSSCKTNTNAGYDCVACESPDFFHCPSTGFCINKELVCDHHPHPSCGGDDEGIYHCLDVYFKKRIVKKYATLICPSKVYPGRKIV